MSEDEEPSEVQDGCFLAFVWFISQDSDVAVDNEDDVWLFLVLLLSVWSWWLPLCSCMKTTSSSAYSEKQKKSNFVHASG